MRIIDFIRHRRLLSLGLLVGACSLIAYTTLRAPEPAAAALTTNSVVGTTLTVAANSNDAVIVTCAAGDVRVNSAVVSGGVGMCASLTTISISATGAFANNIAIDGTGFAAVSSLTIDAGDGDDNITLDANNSLVSLTTLSLNANAGNDTIVVNGALPDGLSANDVIDGGAGTNTINVIGTGGADTVTVGVTTITYSGTVTLSNFGGAVATRTIQTIGGPDTIDSVSAIVGWTIDAGADSDRVRPGIIAADNINGGTGSADRLEYVIPAGNALSSTATTVVVSGVTDTIVANTFGIFDVDATAIGTTASIADLPIVNHTTGSSIRGSVLTLAGTVTTADQVVLDVVSGTETRATFTMIGAVVANKQAMLSPTSLIVDLNSGADTVTVNGTDAADTITAIAPTTLNFPLPSTTFNAAVETRILNGNGGDDVFNLAAATNGYQVNGGAGNDQMIGSATVGEVMNGDDGDDTIDGLGGADIVNGGEGNDVVDGGSAADISNDTVNGGNGNDTLIAWVAKGNDTLNGNAGIDTLELRPDMASGFSTTVTATTLVTTVVTGTDTYATMEALHLYGGVGTESLVVDGGAGTDSLDVSPTSITMSGITPASFRDYENLSSNLGAGSNSMSLSGTADSDNIQWLSSTQWRFNGGAICAAPGFTCTVGSTTALPLALSSFAGDDTINLGLVTGAPFAGATVTIDPGSGIDTITGTNAATIANVYNVGLGSAAITGGIGSDVINVNDPPNHASTFVVSPNTITRNATLITTVGAMGGGSNIVNVNGYDGNDEFTLGSPAGLVPSLNLLGGADDDHLTVVGLATPDNLSTSDTAVTYNGAGVGFSSFETRAIDGGAGADTISAAAASTPWTLNGQAGDDIITGGTGNDTIIAGLGNDTVNGGGGTNTLRFLGSSGNDTISVNASLPFLSSSAGGFAAVSNIAVLEAAAEAGDDTFTVGGVPSGFGSVSLLGGTGDSDLIAVHGTPGDDTVTIGTNSFVFVDTATFADIDHFSVTAAGGNDIVDGAATNLALSIVGGPGDDSLTGGSADDLFTCGEGVDTIVGGGGNNTAMFLGTSSTDVVTLTASAPIVSANAGADAIATATQITTLTLDLYDGTDELVVDGVPSGFSAIAANAGAGTDTMTVNGSNNADSMTLDGSTFTWVNPIWISSLEAATLWGNGGNDVLDASASNVSVELAGGPGNDIMRGGSGADLLISQAGNDTIVGNGGSDIARIEGTSSADVLTLSDNVNTRNGEIINVSTVEAIQAYALGADDHVTLTPGSVFIFADGGAGTNTLRVTAANSNYSYANFATVTVDPNPTPPTPTNTVDYRIASSTGQVFSFGDTSSIAMVPGATGIVGIAEPEASDGYWLASWTGAVFTQGSVPFHGSLGGIRLNDPIVDIAAHGVGGYWLVGADGGVFSFGDAPYFGGLGGVALNAPILGIAPTPSGNGYWLLAADGGVFSFGDARFYGSTGGMTLNAPIAGIAPTPSGHGYWLVAVDGGVFSFGDAPFLGSMGGQPLNEPVKSIAADEFGTGYRIMGQDGGIFTFGTATFRGSAAGPSLFGTAVAID